MLKKYIYIIFILLILAYSFFGSVGTADVKLRKEWVDLMQTFGLHNGYQMARPDYPPLSLMVLFLTAKIDKFTFLDFQQSHHLTLLFFMLLTSFVFYKISKNLPLSIILFGSLFLLTMVLGYGDIMYASFLLLCLYYLSKRSYLLAGLFYGITIFIKWQPLIIFPFLIAFVIDFPKIFTRPNIVRVVLFIAPVILTFLVFFSTFGSEIFLSLSRTTKTHLSYSGNALNLGWVVSYFVQILNKNIINSELRTVTYLPSNIDDLKVLRLAFYVFYAFAFTKFSLSKKTYKQLITALLLTTYGYFVLNSGVHENHLVLTMILAFIYYPLFKKSYEILTFFILMTNINLLIFYGIGSGWPWVKPEFVVDYTFLFALINIFYFISLTAKYIKDLKFN